ncbi:aminopeptidase P family protein [Prevotella lacticifex]|uniref:Xaa-Pro aminopeptidase n=1 Tax=Prevotella lacticifex TaxID=2854755 RepID=A0A9R1C9W7_9BACT|nr:aminopeptidase P family protein [Prevotella lacticifex]GJG35463.1 Xaa-Pro dipeptidase [Prevotella lacticifex]GJG39487.1 Xaa-Pro dipeptidase [Prevotella lacticifex]GJG41831.1 Xaa-Pro dipeptidase [Prevotella lacticifex]GJG45844.1 Xaa-Pro dipeptidase [Prevotella lacticifex]GJG48182.1 Xaa-Pro dipeptidase [Prevotella lacticifex]
MFSKQTYINRRQELKKLVGTGVVILFGNNESPANFPANGYYPFRQDSSFLYFFGQQRDGLIGVIDIDNDIETLVGDDIDIDDIVWYGSVDSVHDMAEQVGVANSAPMKTMKTICNDAMRNHRKIHFLPPYRHDIMIQIFDLLGIHPNQQKESASMDLIKAVVKMRSTKTQEEIDELERAAVIGYKMHTTAMRLTKPGVTEKFIGGQVDGIANSYGSMVSFPTIFSQHGEIMHGNPSMAELQSGRLVLCDAGAETINHYCSDNTRTYPVNGKFTDRQLSIYKVVEECHDQVLQLARPGVKYADVHFAICRIIFNRMKELGLARGNTEDAIAEGAHAMFLPHGLGHMMGMDVHDMESLDQINVGFDEETRPNLEQFGTNCLRMGRRLEEGFVVTDEPGIYFIPDLIDKWRAENHCADFLNFDELDKYKDFGGIRIEDDVLITKDGCRFIGKDRIPYHPQDVEEFMKNN